MDRLISADALMENHFSPSHRIALSYADKQWMRKIISEAPTVDAVPVEFIKGELERLKANRIDADSDDVDYAWDLKMKIEALSDLLGAWEDTYEIDLCR